MSRSDVGGRSIESRPVPLWLPIAIVVLTTVATFWPVLRGTFSYWDDEDTIRYNAHLDPPTWASLLHRWTAPHLNIYVPLTHTVWHGLALLSPHPADPRDGVVVAWPFKTASVGVHALAAVAVLLLARRILGRGWPALIASLVFAVHPLQVESVAWASGLKDELFGLFATFCLFFYVGGETDRARPRGVNVGVALACLVLAGLSKPTAMVVPAMMLAADVVWLRRRPAESLARLVPFALVGIAFAVAARAFQPASTAFGVGALSPFQRPLVVVDSLTFYLSKLVWPASLAMDYGRTADVALASGFAVLATESLIVLAVATAVFALRRRVPVLPLAALWFVLPLAPTLGLVTFDFSYYSTVADHYAYLAMLGVAVGVGGFITAIESRRACRVASAAAIGLLVVWCVLSWRQTRTWREPRSISLQTLQVNPRSAASWANLALADLRDGKDTDAAEHLREAYALRPRDPGVLSMLSDLRDRQGDLPGAIDLIRRALAESPYNAGYRFHLAELLRLSDHVEEALPLYEEVTRMDPARRDAPALAEGARRYLRQRAATRPASGPTTDNAAPR